MAGIAGRRSVVKVLGTPTALTAEATTSAGDNLNYQITNAAKRVLSPTATITVLVAGSPVSASTYTLDRLIGKVTFLATASRVVTITGTYLPTASAARTDKYNFAMSTNSVDDTDFDTANTDNGFSRRQATMKDISGTIGGKIDVVGTFRDNFLNDDLVLLEFFPDRASTHDLICWARLSSFALNSAMDAVVGQDIAFTGAADADLRVVSV